MILHCDLFSFAMLRFGLGLIWTFAVEGFNPLAATN